MWDTSAGSVCAVKDEVGGWCRARTRTVVKVLGYGTARH